MCKRKLHQILWSHKLLEVSFFYPASFNFLFCFFVHFYVMFFFFFRIPMWTRPERNLYYRNEISVDGHRSHPMMKNGRESAWIWISDEMSMPKNGLKIVSRFLHASCDREWRQLTGPTRTRHGWNRYAIENESDENVNRPVEIQTP